MDPIEKNEKPEKLVDNSYPKTILGEKIDMENLPYEKTDSSEQDSLPEEESESPVIGNS